MISIRIESFKGSAWSWQSEEVSPYSIITVYWTMCTVPKSPLRPADGGIRCCLLVGLAHFGSNFGALLSSFGALSAYRGGRKSAEQQVVGAEWAGAIARQVRNRGERREERLRQSRPRKTQKGKSEKRRTKIESESKGSHNRRRTTPTGRRHDDTDEHTTLPIDVRHTTQPITCPRDYGCTHDRIRIDGDSSAAHLPAPVAGL